MRRGHAPHGPAQQIESLVHGERGDVGGHSAARRRLVDRDEVARLAE